MTIRSLQHIALTVPDVPQVTQPYNGQFMVMQPIEITAA